MADNIKVLGTGTSRIYSNLKSIDKRRVSDISRIDYQIEKYSDKVANSSWFNIGGGVVEIGGGILSTIATSGMIGGGWGILVSGIGSVLSGIGSLSSAKANKEINKLNEQKQNLGMYYSALTENLSLYGQSLENRDEYINSARESLMSSITRMNNAYGADFTKAIRGLFYSKNGINSSVYSLFNNNYRTFNEHGHGEVGGFNEGDFFDESTLVTSGADYFNNNFSELELGDLNEKLTNQLYNMLMTSGTSFAEQVSGMENDVRDLISSVLSGRREYVQEIQKTINGLSLDSIQNSLNFALSVGQAEASRAISGIRGASASSNVNIQNLAKDLADLEESYQKAYIASKIVSDISGQQYTVAQNIARVRANERLALKQATEQAISGWNETARGIKDAGREANKQLNEANKYYYSKCKSECTEKSSNRKHCCQRIKNRYRYIHKYC